MLTVLLGLQSEMDHLSSSKHSCWGSRAVAWFHTQICKATHIPVYFCYYKIRYSKSWLILTYAKWVVPAADLRSTDREKSPNPPIKNKCVHVHEVRVLKCSQHKNHHVFRLFLPTVSCTGSNSTWGWSEVCSQTATAANSRKPMQGKSPYEWKTGLFIQSH